MQDLRPVCEGYANSSAVKPLAVKSSAVKQPVFNFII